MSEPTLCPLIRGTPEHPLVHLEFAETNNPELAVFDDSGRVALLIFSVSLNNPYVVKKWDADPVDGTHSIAGSYWLPVHVSTGPAGEKATRQSYNVLYGPAKKAERGYHYESSFVHAETPGHPQPGRSALLTLTTSGVLTMFWMQVNNKLEETRLELDSMGNSDELVTHAAFASEKSMSPPLPNMIMLTLPRISHPGYGHRI